MSWNVSPRVKALAELELRRRRRASIQNLSYGDLRILAKSNEIVLLNPNRAQSDLLATMQHSGGRHLILKARQLGISTVVQAHLFLTAIQQTARIGTLAHDDKTTQKLRDMMRLFHDELPVKVPRSVDNAAQMTFGHTRSSVYIATAGNRTAGRGGTYSHVHGSEVAYWKDGTYIMAGLMQGVPADGQIVLESTANGQQGWFYEQCMRALDGDSAWTLHFFPWWYEDGYRLPLTEPLTLTDEERVLAAAHGLDDGQIAWRRAKQRELGDLFAQEYPEDPYSAFVASSRGYFDLSGVRMDAQADKLPAQAHRYVAGLDFGQANDYTVCSVLDTSTLEQVALLRLNRLPWTDMRRAVLELCKTWNVEILVAEANSMGGTNIEAMMSEFEGDGVGTRIVAFTTTHARKASLMAELKQALPDIRLLQHVEQRAELLAFESKQTSTGAWVFGAPVGMHDDTVMALALAWYAVGRGGSIFVFGDTV